MNQIVATIRKGHVIRTQQNDWLVVGTSNIRGTYRYSVMDRKNSKRASLVREDVLQAQRDGIASVVSA